MYANHTCALDTRTRLVRVYPHPKRVHLHPIRAYLHLIRVRLYPVDMRILSVRGGSSGFDSLYPSSFFQFYFSIQTDYWPNLP